MWIILINNALLRGLTMHTLNKKSVTTPQLIALNNVYCNAGRTWKDSLLRAWSDGRYSEIVFDRNEQAELQTLRNLYGRQWLSGITTKSLKTVHAKHWQSNTWQQLNHS